MAVQIGSEFENYEALTNSICMYEEENFVNLIVRDTRTVEAAAKRNHHKSYNPAIKYSDISFCCTYGGKKYVSHSTGKRNHKTIKQSCPFSLKVRATLDGQRLFVREFQETHNHAISEAEFRFHPKQRKLDRDSQEEVAALLALEPDKRLLRRRLMEVTGKVILMKDIHNIKTRMLDKKGTWEGESEDNRKRDREEESANVDGHNVVERSRKAFLMRSKKSKSASNGPKSVISLPKDSKEALSVLKNLRDDSMVKENSSEIHRDDTITEGLFTVPLASCLPLQQLADTVNPITQIGQHPGQQQQLQNPHHTPLHHQSQNSTTVLPTTAILHHHSYLDTPSSSVLDHQHQPQSHNQQQFASVLQSPSLYAVNIQQASTEQMYNIGPLQHQNILSFSPSVMATNTYTSITTTTTTTTNGPLTSVIHGTDTSESFTTIIVNAGCVLENPQSPAPSSCCVTLDNAIPAEAAAVATEGQFSSWGAIETVEKPSGVRCNSHGSHQLDPDQVRPMSHTEAFSCILADPHQQHPTHLNINNNNNISSNMDTTNPIISDQISSPVTSILPPSSSSVLILSNASDPQSNTYTHHQQQPQQQHCYQQQVNQHEQQQQHHVQSQSCTPNPNTSLMTGKILYPSSARNVDSGSISLQAPKRRIKSSMSKKESERAGVRKMKRSGIQRDKDNLMKKYFQQATVNLFFNERLKFTGNKFCQTVNTSCAKMSGKQEDLKYNEALKPLSWLFGKWRSEQGMGKYPTIQDFTYIEEAEFSPIGMQPNVEYKFYSCHPNTKAPMHRETGFIKIKPGTNHIAFVAAHNFGVVDMQEGEVTGQELSVTSSQPVGRTSFNKDPQVKQTTRSLKRTSDQLEHILGMETENTALTEHLRITFSKV